MATIQSLNGDTISSGKDKINTNFANINNEVLTNLASGITNYSKTNERISDIIAQSGTSGTEVVNARGGFTVLNDRLVDVDSSLTNNVQQVNQSYESGFKSSASVKKSAPVGTVVFCDDDGASEVLTELKAFAISKGIPWCLAIMPNSPILLDSETELKELQDIYGWEICAHNDMALTTYTEAEINAHAQDISQTLRSKGFNVNNYIYPNGLFSDLTQKVLSKYFRSASSTGQTGGNPYGKMKMYELERSGSPSITYPGTLESLQPRIDLAYANNDLLVFTTHIWNMEASHVQLLSDIIDYVKSLGMPITTLNKALDDFAPIVSTGYSDETDYFHLLRNGKIASNVAKTKIVPPNSFLNSDGLGLFEKDMVTVSIIGVANATGFPNNNAGTLTTSRLSNAFASTDHYNFQTYKEFDNYKMHVRYAYSTTNWSSWAEIATSQFGMHKVVTANSFVASTPITDYPLGITTCAVTTAYATGLPAGDKAGLVTTYKILEHGYYRQEYRRYISNEIWIRYVGTNDLWTEFLRLGSGYGDSTVRPLNAYVGYPYFDTTLGIPIMLKAVPSTWVDGTGTTV